MGLRSNYLRWKQFRPWDFRAGLHEIARLEREPGIELPLAKRIAALRAGFQSTSWLLYGFEEHADPDYLPDAPHLLYTRRLNRNGVFFANKLLFPAVFGGMLDVPPNLCIISRGAVLPLAASRGLMSRDLESVLEWCRTEGPLIWKPIGGSGGHAVHRIGHDAAAGFRIDAAPADDEAVRRLARSRVDFLVSPAARQGNYARTIFAGAVSTVRLWIMRDPDSGSTFLAAAAHKFATERSAPVDNWKAGGLVAPIDIDTGVIDRAAPYPVAGRLAWRDDHPDTGATIRGVAVPNWHDTVNELLSVTGACPGIEHCAWDISFREDGFTAIEGNNYPMLAMLQLRRGLLADARVRRFFEHHGVIDRRVTPPRAAGA